MARIAGLELKDNLRVDYALTKIKGVGWASSQKILGSVGINLDKRVKELTSDDIAKITAKLEEAPTGGELDRKTRGDIRRLQQIGTYRGIRHQRGLPVRGQRTRTNARTKRGKRKTVGAFKKEILTKMDKPEKKESE